MKTFNVFIAAITLSIAATGVASADSVADQQVRSALSESVIQGQSQPVVNHQHVMETGKSVAASRVEQSLNSESLKGQQLKVTSSSQQFVNDAGKSVSASRFESALNDNA